MIDAFIFNYIGRSDQLYIFKSLRLKITTEKSKFAYVSYLHNEGPHQHPLEYFDEFN